MALINQNSIIGVTSITSPSASNVLTFHTNDTTERLRVTPSGVSFSGTNASLDTSGNLTIAGVLTYEDVTSVDSVGIITAQSGIKVLSGGANITGIVTASAGFQFGSTPSYFYGTGTDSVFLRVGDGPYAEFIDAGSNILELGNASGALALTSSGTEKVRITSSGNVGIGTDNPALRAHIYSTAATDAALIESNQNHATLRFKSAVNSSGPTIGIDGGGGLQFDQKDTSKYISFAMGSNGEKLRIAANGDIGIANASPTNWGSGVPTIEIKGTVSSGGNSTRSGAIAFESGSGNNGYAALWGQNGGIHIYTGATDRASATYAAQFNSSGNLAFASGNGIDFSANSNASGMTSEVLDDYEEGAFEPRLRFGTSTEIGTFNTQSKAEYVKVGKIVHVSGWARYDSVNTGNSGILHLDLPFTVDEYGMPHNYVYPGSVVLTHTDLQQKGIHVWCGNAGAARTRFGFYNSTSGSTDYIENGDLSGWNGNTRNLHFNFSYQTND